MAQPSLMVKCLAGAHQWAPVFGHVLLQRVVASLRKAGCLEQLE